VPKPFEDYNIDQEYYLKAIYDEIRKIESAAPTVDLSRSKAAQLSLF
jgi:hypothetical protein